MDRFLEDLRRSGLMSAGEIDDFVLSLPPQAKSPAVPLLVEELVRRGHLTRYQAERIVQGQPQGLVLGNYLIQDKIGEGGMGEVFMAEHRRMKRPVVVKILPQRALQSQQALRRFQREVEAAAQLHHPNVVTAYDADEEDGIHYLVMEYVDGLPLGDLVSREGPFPLIKSLLCILQAARGLEYAHAQGIVHRDIKPNNLLLDRRGIVKVLDMGLARFDDGRRSWTDLQNDPQGESLTRDHQIIGTVEYMAPEQVDDSSAADRRSDIYSLGCTWFRLLTNRPPYLGESLVQTILAHRTDPIPSVAERRPEIPPRVDEILSRMLAKSPEERYQNMGDVILDLEQLLAQTGGDGAASEFRGLTGSPTSPLPSTTSSSATGESAARGESWWGESSSSERTRYHHESSTADIDLLEGLASRVVGIDLGTTFSAIAHIDATGRPVVLENAEGDKTTPSVVLVDGRELVVGREALKALPTDWMHVAECMKRDMGSAFYSRRVDNREFPPEVLQACVLHKLRQDAQRILGEVSQAVITVPAYFDEVRRKATQDAGYIAGLEVLDIINEPTAAALAYFHLRGPALQAETANPKRLLVYDLGGGTFDVTVMEYTEGEFLTLATDGDVRLGGRDWDQRLVDYAAESFLQATGEDPREDLNSYGRLLHDCEDAKRTLSTRHKTTLVVSYANRAEKIEITREKFEELTADLLQRTEFTTRQVLEAAHLAWNEIDIVLAVGGSTRMPAVLRLLRTVAGREPDTSISPDEAVAQGAAIHAHLLIRRLAGQPPRVRVRNVNSHSLGIVATDPRTQRRHNAVLVPRNTPLPARAKRVFRTQKLGQRSVVAQIIEGESSDPTECTQIGKCIVRGLPENLPAGTPVEVRFQYEENGRLRVTVHVAGHQNRVSHEFTRENNLTRQELDAWRTRFLQSPGDPPGVSPSLAN